ncbi:MAG TPA: hypothetical protein VGP47_02760 [Parachlamydiaceae bacterium]|nr:hypothetical protein [Parachlamydiaceae bacterium]
MSILNSLSNALSSTKKAWLDPVDNIKEVAAIAPITSLPSIAGPGSGTYYIDTISKSGDELPNISGSVSGNFSVPEEKGRFESKLDQLTAKMNTELMQDDRDFDRLQTMIYQVIMMMMRMAAKSDLENIQEITVKVKKQAGEIQATYNTWQGLTVTIISSTVSVAGGCAGLAPFFIAGPAAVTLQGASQGIASAGTGLSGIGSVFNNRSEGQRQVYQIHLKRLQDTEEERKGSKHTKGDHIKTAKAALEEFFRTKHEAHKAATGG